MICDLWLEPPLAFARLGNANEPLESFFWGPNDEKPSGTSKTTILPAKTFLITEDGSSKPDLPKHITFSSENGIKAVCPFFELHGRWRTADGKCLEGPITEELLVSLDHSTKELTWQIKVANLKPYFMTKSPDTRIEAEVDIQGNDFNVHKLEGRSPAKAAQPLVPVGQSIALGSVRVIKPNAEAPVCRLRFFPPTGEIYGPTNFKTRDFGNDKYELPDSVLILNENSIWCRFKPAPEDRRGLPGDQFAHDRNGVSLGLVDDISDGIISCRLIGTELVASARVVVTPPHFAPDRRHFISIADGLKDRMDRAEVHSSSYISNKEQTYRLAVDEAGNVIEVKVSNHDMAKLEIRDLMERVLETMGLSNLDAYNNRIEVLDNPLIAITSGQPYPAEKHKVFNVEPTLEEPLPLVALGRNEHRRLSALQILETNLQQRLAPLEELVRPPLDPNPFYDRRMPTLMHGSIGEPLHLTRRQYDLLAAWVALLRADIEEDS